MYYADYGNLTVDEWRQMQAPELVYHLAKGKILEKSIEHLQSKKDYSGWDDYVGAGMMGVGVAMLIPGPVDALFATAGAAITKTPAGAVAGLAVYNALALVMLGTGYYLTELD